MKMQRLSIEDINKKLFVDIVTGKCYKRDEEGHYSLRSATGYPNINKEVLLKIAGQSWVRRYLVWLTANPERAETVLPRDIVPINGDRGDDRIVNLKCLTPVMSRKAHLSRRREGKRFVGVHRTENGSYVAQLRYNGHTHNLGTHPTATEAFSCYITAKQDNEGVTPEVKHLWTVLQEALK